MSLTNKSDKPQSKPSLGSLIEQTWAAAERGSVLSNNFHPKWYQTIPVCNDKRNECIWCLHHDDWFNTPTVRRNTKCDCDPAEGKKTNCESRCYRPHEHKRGWFIFIFRGGRGTGKTARGREIAIAELREKKQYARVGIGAASNVEARKIAEGDQGLIKHYGHEFVKYNRSPGLCEAWHEGGGYVYFAGMDAEDAKAWNGENLSMLWVDEAGLCREDSVKQAILCVRKGDNPFIVFTGTPKRAKWLRDMEKREDIAVRFGQTSYNDSLPEVSRQEFYNMFAGTSYERSELKGEHVEKVEGALWDIDIIDKYRRAMPDPSFITIGWAAVDPSVSDTDDSNAAGIAAGGVGIDNHLYVFEMNEFMMPVGEWAIETINTLDRHSLDRVVGEKNNGGDLVEAVIAAAGRIRQRVFIYEGVWASKGKLIRAEPAAQLMNLGLVHHCGVFGTGETQLTEWQPGENSPNAMDAYVWLCEAARPYLLRQTGSPVVAATNPALVKFIDEQTRRRRGY